MKRGFEDAEGDLIHVIGGAAVVVRHYAGVSDRAEDRGTDRARHDLMAAHRHERTFEGLSAR